MLDGVKAIRALILADTEAAALIGARVYPEERPQGSALPAVTITQVAGNPGMGHGGATGLTSGLLQIDCYSEGGTLSAYEEAKTIAKRVRIACNGFRGTVDGVPVRGVFLQSERDTREDGPQGVQRVVMVSLDFDVQTQET